VWFGVRDDLSEAALVFLGKNKARANFVLARQRLAGKDADSAGFLNAEQDAAGLPFTTAQIAAGLDFPADLIEHLGGTLDEEGTLGDLPGFEIGTRGGSRLFFRNFVHAGK